MSRWVWALGLIACASAPPPVVLGEVASIAGVRFAVPTGSITAVTADAIRLREPGGHRSPWNLTLTALTAPPATDCPAHRLTSGRTVRACPREENGGGSGGVGYTREGWMRHGGAVFGFSFDQQAEWPAAPDDAVLWAVLDSAG